MRYTRGQRGPLSRTKFSIMSVAHRQTVNGPLAEGTAIAHVRDGDRGVNFRVQGKNYHELSDRLVSGAELIAHARWNGREAVTFTGAAHIQP